MTYNYNIDHIPTNTPNNRRPRIVMNATTITIHNTGNPKSTAKNERAWLTNPTNNRTASYHIAIDEIEAIEVLPLNEVGWHAGDGSGVNSGNRTSIGIEICESGNYAKTIENTVDLVAKMLLERGWGVDKLRRHWDWSKKICPRLMYDNGTWNTWEQFKQSIQVRLNELKNPKITTQSTQPQYPSAKVTFEGKDVTGIIINGTTYVQIRELANLMNVQIGYNSTTRVTTFNNKVVQGIVLEGRTYLPVREASAIVGINVGWNQQTFTVTLTK